MLWYKLLQNTTYCGILHFTSCRACEGNDWGSFVNYKQKIKGSRQKVKNLSLCIFYHPDCHQFLHLKQLISKTKREEG
jgi:hypothetical protein